MNPYSLSLLILNKAEESRIIKLIMEIVETDLISNLSLELYNERIKELRSLEEHLLVDAIEQQMGN